MEQIGHDRLISQQVLVPRLLRGLLVWLALLLGLLDVRLLAFPVQILAHEVQDRVDALM